MIDLFDNDYDNDCDNDLNPESFSSPLACGAAACLCVYARRQGTPLPYLARSAFP